MIKGLLVKDGRLTETEAEDNLESYYAMLECDLIDIVERRIGGKWYSIVCDDEGLYNEEALISMMHERAHQPMLVGNLFICKDAGRGKLKGLTEDDMRNIREHFKHGCVWGDI